MLDYIYSDIEWKSRHCSKRERIENGTVFKMQLPRDKNWLSAIEAAQLHDSCVLESERHPLVFSG